VKRNRVLPAFGIAFGVAVKLPVVGAGNRDWDAFVGETHVHTTHGD
jgi:hypothetical protein